MKHEIADKWIEALKSGEYKQAREALRNVRGFCCLGVLCDLYMKEHPGRASWRRITEDDVTMNRFISGDFVFEGEKTAQGSLPDEVRRWAGISDGIACYDRDTRALASDNDEGQSFARIAETIEKYKDEL